MKIGRYRDKVYELDHDSVDVENPEDEEVLPHTHNHDDYIGGGCYRCGICGKGVSRYRLMGPGWHVDEEYAEFLELRGREDSPPPKKRLNGKQVIVTIVRK